MCESRREIIHAAGLRERNIIIVFKDFESLPLWSIVIVTVVIPRRTAVLVVLIAIEEGKHRSLGLSGRAASSIGIKIGECRPSAHWLRTLSFYLSLIVFVRLRA